MQSDMSPPPSNKQPATKESEFSELPAFEPLSDDQPPHKKQSPKKKYIIISALIGALLLTVLAAMIGWFILQTLPKDPQGQQKRIVISSGMTPSQIATHLEQSGIIRSDFAFQTLAKIRGQQNDLKAGTYVLSPAQSTLDVLSHLAEGKVDPFRVTIIPGQTLKELTASLQKYGFKEESIKAALEKKYTHPVLASKPTDASLEGYIFPETYEIEGDATVEELLEKSFDELHAYVQEGQIEQKLKARNLTLHQGIILASIIQKEVSSPEDQQQVAQIFHERLSKDMPLGADATFVYAAKQLGVEPSVNLESPYNTRINKGLTPGPIANFNSSALAAVADPAPGNFLYFVSGDDGNTYYSVTLEEHEQKTKQHCIELCSFF